MRPRSAGHHAQPQLRSASVLHEAASQAGLEARKRESFPAALPARAVPGSAHSPRFQSSESRGGKGHMQHPALPATVCLLLPVSIEANATMQASMDASTDDAVNMFDGMDTRGYLEMLISNLKRHHH